MAIYKKEDVLGAMSGKWEQALLDLCGWDRAAFKGRHGPCPICGGTDRFRWGHKQATKRGEGFGYCSGSCGGARDGMFWFMESRKQPFNEAVNDLGDWIGGLTPEKRETIVKEAKKLAKLQDKPGMDAELTPEQVDLVMSKGAVRGGFLYVPCARPLGGSLGPWCNVAKISSDGSVAFAAGGPTWGAVGMIHPAPDAPTIYLVADPVHASRVAARTECEVWLTFRPMNAVQVSALYDGDREIRFVVTDLDEAFLYGWDRTGRASSGGDLVGAFG